MTNHLEGQELDVEGIQVAARAIQRVAYLKGVLTTLPTQLKRRIEALLPHLWKSVG